MKSLPSIAIKGLVFVLALAIPFISLGAELSEASIQLPTSDYRAIFCVIVFLFSYLFVITEEKTLLRKSKPVMLGAGIIWVIIAFAAPEYGVSHEQIQDAVYGDLDQYASLFLFLLAAMTYVGIMEEANVFEALRGWLINQRYSYRRLFWIIGVLTFFLSPLVDNLTTALVMGAVVIAVGTKKPDFVVLSMINVVCAANAGGVFSPFGDITTLMVWQSGRLGFFDFFALFLPALISYIVPALLMSFFIPKGVPTTSEAQIKLHRGAYGIILLFILTITMAISFEQFLGLPPFMGMMTGMSMLMFYTYYLRATHDKHGPNYDVFVTIRGVEWDTLLFFFGVIFSVGGLAAIGYMELASQLMYDDWGATPSNIGLGVISAVIDNIPVMFSVLTMQPEMEKHQWLLITLTCGIGGSLLPIGSAAGVALMGVSKGKYSFTSHLKWTPVILLGYILGIATHFLLNG